MLFESKKILIASAIFNVFVMICFSCLAVHCSGKYYALNKVISEQNKTISKQTNFEKVNVLTLYSFLIKIFNEVLYMQVLNKTISEHKKTISEKNNYGKVNKLSL